MSGFPGDAAGEAAGGVVSRPAWLGLDVGGANVKYAVAVDGPPPRLAGSGSLPFPLWREPGRLPDRLREAARRAGRSGDPPPWPAGEGPPAVALTLTGELADCFPSREEGVRRIVDAVAGAWEAAALRVWSSDGSWRSPGEARGAPLDAAAANWRAPAAWLARRGREVLLGDMGSTTTDLVPVREGRVATEARTDLERLRAGELVYTGLLRTPVCALVDRVELEAGPVPVAAELFAVAADAHLWLGHIGPDAYRCETPDGGPATRSASGRRLARMLCSDPEELGPGSLDALAGAAARAQARRVIRAVRRQRDRHGEAFPPTACCTGAGADLLASWLRRAGLRVEETPPPLSGRHAPAATAGALALLALEDHGAGGER